MAYENSVGASEISSGGGLPATSDTVFFAASSAATVPVKAERRQVGCLRFCFVPDASLTPRRYRCLQGEIAETWFENRKYGNPAYMQLHDRLGSLLMEAGSNGDELGVWNYLRNSSRQANIWRAIEGFLRYGMEAGIEMQT